MVGAPGSLSAPFKGPTVDVALMIGAPGSTALAPLGGPPLMFLSVDGGHSWIYRSGTRQGARRRCFLHQWWMLSDLCQHSPGGPPSTFFTLMVGAPGSIAPAPPREPIVDVFYVDGGCSQLSVNTHQGTRRRRSIDGGRSRIYSFGTSKGVYCRYFLALMVGTPGSTALAPPREPTIDVFYIDGRCSQISISTHQGPAVDVFYIDGGCSRIFVSTRQEARHRRFLR
jgi:hypothetical protein